jgi:sulfopyruvate decarboxylase TPP-binding subunit
VVPREARASAVGLMTMIGFCGAGLTPIFVAQASATFGMATAMASMAVLYVLAVALLMSTRTRLRRTVIETRLGEHSHSESRP